MNLRIVPAIPSQPTVIFSLNWHAPPATLSLPHYYSTQLVACQDARIPVPRNPLAVDKAVGMHLLIDSVTFDLSRKLVIVAWIDGQSLEWPVDETKGFKEALEDVLECVRLSGVEAEKEKKAATAAVLAAKANASGHSRSESVPSTSASAPEPVTPTASPINGHRRHRTASGIFSSIVASFITPPSSPPNKDANSPSSSSAALPDHLSGMYRPRRNSSQVYHRQHVFHPTNKRETLPTQPVAQSRYLRRQARAKLVDIFRYYVAARLTLKLRAAGIVGDELRERGILDDLEDFEDGDSVSGQTGPMEGTGGFVAAGGYVAYMARSMLRNALVEVQKNHKMDDGEDSWSSSDESLLLTPKDVPADVPSDATDYMNAGEPKSAPSSRSSSPAKSVRSPSRRRATPTPPQTQQIRHLSSVLIGLTQKDKRTTADEREVLEMVKERSLRRRWSLAENAIPASPTARPTHRRSTSLPTSMGFARPLVGSPLREVEVADYEFPGEEARKVVPFPTTPRRAMSLPAQATTGAGGAPFDEDAADVTDARDEIPIVRDDVSTTVVKAFEAEDVDRAGNNGRTRREALRPTTASSTAVDASPASTDVKKGHGRSNSCPPIMLTFSTHSSSSGSGSDSSSDSDDSEDMEMEITDSEGYSLTIPAPAAPTGTIQTIYATMPKSPVSPTATSPTFAKLAQEGEVMVRGLELDIEQVEGQRHGESAGVSGGYWPHLADGIFVV